MKNKAANAPVMFEKIVMVLIRIEIIQGLPTFELGPKDNRIVQLGYAFIVSNTFKLTYDLHLNCSFPDISAWVN